MVGKLGFHQVIKEQQNSKWHDGCFASPELDELSGSIATLLALFFWGPRTFRENLTLEVQSQCSLSAHSD